MPDQDQAPIARLRVLIAPLLLFSCITNLAILISPIFMMQVLDRVVPSGNISTLLLLLAVALGALALSGVIEWSRDTSLRRSANWVQKTLAPRAFDLPIARQQPFLDALTSFTEFLSSARVVGLMNIVWIPLFLFALALIHPIYMVLVAVVVGIAELMALIMKSLTKSGTVQANSLAQSEISLAQKMGHLVSSMRMKQTRQNLTNSYLDTQGHRLSAQDDLSSSDAKMAAAQNFLRMSAQLLALALGAYLVSQNALSAGGMIAASIIASKTISIADQSISAVRSLPDLKSSLITLNQPPDPIVAGTDIDEFSGALSCEGLIFPRGGGAPPRLDRIKFALAPGDCLAIIGDASGGKSTLLAALAGLAPAPIGTVFLDQSDVRHLPLNSWQKAIGYLPQHANLLSGTIAQNIASFDPNADDAAVVAAAKKARVHGLISTLPDGYATDVEKTPYLLTSGQQQQIALAAAIYHNPTYLFLDEPNSMLDRNAERALVEILADLKGQGTTIVMILHRAGAIGLADKVLMLDAGRMTDFGLRAEVLGRQLEGHRRIRLALLETSLQDLTDWISGQFTRSSDAHFSAKAVTLGREMFQGAIKNGPGDTPREVQVSFKFIDDENAELRMVEQGFTDAEAVMVKVNAAIQDGTDELVEFGPSELPLLAASRLASKLEIRNKNELATFFAHLHVEAQEPKKGRAI